MTPAFPNDPAAPEAYLINLVPSTSPQDPATTALVTTLRDDVIPAATAGTSLDVKVTGLAAANIDFTDFLAERTFLFFGAVLAMSFLLLMMVFRSLLVPLKAVVMNVCRSPPPTACSSRSSSGDGAPTCSASTPARSSRWRR